MGPRFRARPHPGQAAAATEAAAAQPAQAAEAAVGATAAEDRNSVQQEIMTGSKKTLLQGDTAACAQG